MDNQINIQKENVLNAYKSGNQDQKALLENLFGRDIFHPKDIKERIKTFEDACGELGNEHPFVKSYEKYVNTASGEEADVIAYLKLRIIVAALNEGWEPIFDKGERRYYPLFYLYTQKEYEKLDEDEKKSCRAPLWSVNYALAHGSFVCAGAGYAGSGSFARYGVQLAFKTEELADYCGKQFIDIWADFLFA